MNMNNSRSEEIKQAAKNRADQYEHPVDWNNCYHHYIQGAEWADQHPRKGLWDSEKVCKFIKESVREYHKSGVFHVDDFINDLHKAMNQMQNNEGITALKSFDAIMTVVDKHRPFVPDDFKKESFIPDLD